MPQVLIRNVDQDILNRLKIQASTHGRSLQAELKTILEESVRQPQKLSVKEFLKEIERLHKGLGRCILSDSAELIRKDRER